MNIEVEFYETASGEIPVREFLDSLDNKMRAKMLRDIMLLEMNGTELREPFSKSLGDGLFELRAKIGSDISHTLYFFFVGGRAVLTNGFIKKTRKTPVSEIERARRYRADYLSREGIK